MRVLSLFDGMACGMIAFKALGIEVDSYDAYEIDKYAIQTATHNFPKIKEHGDVFTADFTQYKGVDFVVGGSPCTYWSIAQKNNRQTEASGMGWELFSQYLRAVKEAEPKYFIYENNYSMSAAIRASIDKAFGFEAVYINSALVSAQNRKRLYWVGKRNADGSYSKVDVEQPNDRGILLRDILESGITWKEKQHTIDANYSKGGNFTNMQKQSGQRLAVAECVGVGYRNRRESDGNLYRRFETHGEEKATTVQTDSMVAERIPPYGVEDKARPLNAHYANNCGGFEHRVWSDNPNKQQVDLIAEPIGTTADGKGYCLTANYCGAYPEHTLKRSVRSMVAEPLRVGTMPQLNGVLKDNQATRVYSIDGKGVTQNANGGGWGAKTGLYAVPVCHTIPQEVTVRKYTCDIEKLKILLRESKNKTNKEIAQKLNKPLTLVEHWFRNDNCFAVPDADVWFELKKLLNIESTEFDDFVTIFETRDGVFDKANRCYDVNGKMSTLMTTSNDNIIAPVKVGEIGKGGQGYRVYSVEGKSVAQTATSGGIGSNTGLYAIPTDKPIYEVKDGFITIKGKQYPIKLADGYYIIRKLTVTECKRLQTIPEWYDFPVSNAQAYKMLGNGWTVEVIAHLIRSALTNKTKEDMVQMSVFDIIGAP